MALRRFNLAVKAASLDTLSQGVDGTAASFATLTSNIAAAQAIGIGNASAEIDAIDATFMATVNPTAPGSLVIVIDDAVLTSRSAIRAALDRFMEKLEQYPNLFTP